LNKFTVDQTNGELEYNRSLTPFGFQNEERTYWQAPEVYYKMSPFSYADKIKTPSYSSTARLTTTPAPSPSRANVSTTHSKAKALPFASSCYTWKPTTIRVAKVSSTYYGRWKTGSTNTSGPITL
jgi:hypothetical protein